MLYTAIWVWVLFGHMQCSLNSAVAPGFSKSHSQEGWPASGRPSMPSWWGRDPSMTWKSSCGWSVTITWTTTAHPGISQICLVRASKCALKRDALDDLQLYVITPLATTKTFDYILTYYMNDSKNRQASVLGALGVSGQLFGFLLNRNLHKRPKQHLFVHLFISFFQYYS